MWVQMERSTTLVEYPRSAIWPMRPDLSPPTSTASQGSGQNTSQARISRGLPRLRVSIGILTLGNRGAFFNRFPSFPRIHDRLDGPVIIRWKRQANMRYLQRQMARMEVFFAFTLMTSLFSITG